MGVEDRVLCHSWGPEDLAQDADALAYCVMTVPAGRRIEVVAAYLAAQADVSAVDTNYNTVTLHNNAVSGAAICELANGPAATGTDVTQLAVAMDESSTFDAQKEVGSDSAATAIYLEATKTGTGLAIAGLSCHIEYIVRK
ncbi:MAG: hypothetical protein PVH68_06915 [Armatimonadota bacterium]